MEDDIRMLEHIIKDEDTLNILYKNISPHTLPREYTEHNNQDERLLKIQNKPEEFTDMMDKVDHSNMQ